MSYILRSGSKETKNSPSSGTLRRAGISSEELEACTSVLRWDVEKSGVLSKLWPLSDDNLKKKLSGTNGLKRKQAALKFLTSPKDAMPCKFRRTLQLQLVNNYANIAKLQTTHVEKQKSLYFQVHSKNSCHLNKCFIIGRCLLLWFWLTKWHCSWNSQR